VQTCDHTLHVCAGKGKYTFLGFQQASKKSQTIFL
jgi:hypothetical protein